MHRKQLRRLVGLIADRYRLSADTIASLGSIAGLCRVDTILLANVEVFKWGYGLTPRGGLEGLIGVHPIALPEEGCYCSVWLM